MFKLIWLIRENIHLKRRAELLEAKLDAERDRNRAHEDELISRIVTLAGTVGVEARQPEMPKKPSPLPSQDMATVMKDLSPYQRGLLQLYEEEGIARGYSIQQIHNDFYQEHVLGQQRMVEVPQ